MVSSATNTHLPYGSAGARRGGQRGRGADPLLALSDEQLESLRAAVSDDVEVLSALAHVADLVDELRGSREEAEKWKLEELSRREQIASLEVDLEDARAENARLRGKLRTVQEGSDLADIFARYEHDIQVLEARLAERGEIGIGSAPPDASRRHTSQLAQAPHHHQAHNAGGASTDESKLERQNKILQKHLDDACTKLGQTTKALAAKEVKRLHAHM